MLDTPYDISSFASSPPLSPGYESEKKNPSAMSSVTSLGYVMANPFLRKMSFILLALMAYSFVSSTKFIFPSHASRSISAYPYCVEAVHPLVIIYCMLAMNVGPNTPASWYRCASAGQCLL